MPKHSPSRFDESPPKRSPGRRGALTVAICLATAGLGLAFLVVKGFEYSDDLAKGLLPGPNFTLEPPATQLFWGLYWIITLVHAIHLTVGIGLVAWLSVMIGRRIVPLSTPASEVISLYWHFVDVIWVTVYALIYLPGLA